MVRKRVFLMLVYGVLIANAAYAERLEVTMNLFSPEKTLGTFVLEDTPYGLLVTPKLTDLPPGPHGFHIHQNPSCADNGMAAGSHFDPTSTKVHAGPYAEQGHQGDLPVLFVDAEGEANTPLLAPRLTVAALKQHALMIHGGGDNYSDNPPLGGGGARIACGVVSSSLR